jgi:hypothetical protein
MTSSRRPRQRGNMILECVLWLPFIFLLLGGMVQLGKLTYVYYTLQKTLYAAGTYLAAQQGVNFCDLTGDANIQAALNFGLTGTTDATVTGELPALTTDMVTVTMECADPNTPGTLGQCSTTGCDGPGGGPRPDYIVLSIPDGYQLQPRFPYILTDPILFKPKIRVPFGGT